MNITTDYEFQYRERIINIEIAAQFWPGRRAQTYGPPENCYPEEPAECEIDSVTVQSIEWAGDFIKRDDRPAWDRLDAFVLGLAESDSDLEQTLFDRAVESQEDWRY